MRAEEVWKEIPFTAYDVVMLSNCIHSNEYNLNVEFRTKWTSQNKEVKVKISTYSLHGKEVYMMFLYPEKELDVTFHINHTKNLSLIKFGYFKDGESIGKHYVFNTQGDLISCVNYNKEEVIKCLKI